MNGRPTFSPEARKAMVYRALRQLAWYPENWDQGAWRCGTQHCFAGQLSLEAGYTFAAPDFYEAGRYPDGKPILKPNTDDRVICASAGKDSFSTWGVSAQSMGAYVLTGLWNGDDGGLFEGERSFGSLVRGCRSLELITPRQADRLLKMQPRKLPDPDNWRTLRQRAEDGEFGEEVDE